MTLKNQQRLWIVLALWLVLVVLSGSSDCENDELSANDLYCYRWCRENLPKHLTVSKHSQDLDMVKKKGSVYCECTVGIKLPVKLQLEKDR